MPHSRTALSLRVAPVPRETFHSFAGRLAAANGVRLADFAQDLAIPLNRLIALNGDIVEEVAQLGGLVDEQVSSLLSWTGQALQGVRMAYRGEVIVSRAIRNPVVRGCAACLRDAAARTDDPLAEIALSGAWLPRHSLVCLRHERYLVPLWSKRLPRHRYDTQARLSDMLGPIRDASITQLSATPTPYDRWLDQRLETQADASCLGAFSINAAATMCLLVGRRLRDGLDDTEDPMIATHRAYAAGYDVLARGENAFDAFLDSLLGSRRTSGSRSAVFGRLYRDLGMTHRDDEEFAVFRDILREKVFHTWPVAPGEKVLGQALDRRRLHSLASAAEETGQKAETLERLLVARGVIPHASNRSDDGVVFYVEDLGRVVPTISGLVHLAEIRDRMGATETQFDALVTEGLIRPRVVAGNVRKAWAVEDGLAIVERLARRGRAIPRQATGWLPLQEAALRCRVPLAEIFRLIDTEELAVGFRDGLSGYAALHVEAAAVEVRFTPPQQIGLSPSAFGTSVSVKGAGAIQALIDQGLMTVTEIRDPRSGRTHQRVLAEDADSFHRRFYTLHTAVEATGLNWRRLAKIFRQYGVEKFAMPREVAGRVYQKANVDCAVEAFLQDHPEMHR